MSEQPNIIFIHTDQQRGDCLGVEGHPIVQTPNMDGLASKGVRFSKFYSACPSCIAARRSMLTGQNPQTFGLVGYREGLEFDTPTLPQILKENGYQTQHIGRSMHQAPPRKRYGFDNVETSIDQRYKVGLGEYEEWFNEHAPIAAKGHYGIGIMHNDWTAAPWHLDDHLHFGNWTVNRALGFFEHRDPTMPFFLSLGFLSPHPPLQPPEFYFNRYLRTGVDEPVIGDWEKEPLFGDSYDHVASDNINLNKEQLLTLRAGYYGAINHTDDLLRLIFSPIRGVSQLKRDTIIILTSDHGEMLGDHYMFRKQRAYEPSARVPFIITAPNKFGLSKNTINNLPATHADIMPTILDMLDIDIPNTVDGMSLYPSLRGEPTSNWRDCIHIEHAPYHQCVTDGTYKYLWLPSDGSEQFFDLAKDPNEKHNAINDIEYKSKVELWKNKLINKLQNRPEGFVQDGKLVAGCIYDSVIPLSQRTQT